jgi:hypothetical protein
MPATKYILIAAVLLLVSCRAREERARVTLQTPGFTLEVSRAKRPPLQAEHVRMVTLLHPGGLTFLGVFPEFGGNACLSLFRCSESAMLLVGSHERIRIDLAARTLVSDSSPAALANFACGSFVGAFDQDADGHWRFLPASERPARDLRPNHR